MQKINPYYQNNPISFNIIVTVCGRYYTFDCLEHATEFIQQLLAHSVDKPIITLVIYTCEVEK